MKEKSDQLFHQFTLGSYFVGEMINNITIKIGEGDNKAVRRAALLEIQADLGKNNYFTRNQSEERRSITKKNIAQKNRLN